MQVGDVVQVNDLCVLTRFHNAIGLVVGGPFYEHPEPWAMMWILVNGECIKFRQDTPQLEIVQ